MLADGDIEDHDDDDSVEALDDWGWDPLVDQFLLEMVAEAPRQGPVIDFSWVSRQFWETLEPSENQVASALERFSPLALEERWLYLYHQLPQEGQLEFDDLSKGSSEGDEKESGEETTLVNQLPAASDHEDASGVAASSPSCFQTPPRVQPLLKAPVTALHGGAEASRGEHGGRPERDRVLDAMQKLFLGRPSPGKCPAVAVSSSAADESVAVPPVSPLASAAACAEDVVALDALVPTASLTEDRAQASSAEANENPDSAVWGSSNEALRRCLEELRWHGEALRRCATGEDAAQLCAEAAQRRKTLLWSLGVAPALGGVKVPPSECVVVVGAP